MTPFALPEKLDRELARVLSYWEGLRRGGNDIPFWDDLKPAALEGATVFLIDAFAQPERFRFNAFLGAVAGSANLKGRFLDEADLASPFEFLRAQSSAAVEARKATYYRHDGYGRLLLPMWGDGRVSMLLGAVSQS